MTIKFLLSASLVVSCLEVFWSVLLRATFAIKNCKTTIYGLFTLITKENTL
jgi:hypothetical protein